MENRIILRGITWNHSRFYTPLVAAAQRYHELHPDVVIIWDKTAVGNLPSVSPNKDLHGYDLLVIDHPHLGSGIERGLLPLDTMLPEQVITERAKSSSGVSHASYQYNGHQWALAVDTSATVACYREDLMDAHGVQLPSIWKEVISLAAAGRVAVPSFPEDLVDYFFACCKALAGNSFRPSDELVGSDTGQAVLSLLRSLWRFIDKRFFSMGPVQVAECLSAEDTYWYCPFTDGYINYARRGYAKHPLCFSDVVGLEAAGQRLPTVLGGAGLAISATSLHHTEALDFVTWVTAPDVQSGLYAETGGQPALRKAWESTWINLSCGNFFANTLQALDRAQMKPRYNGYMFFRKSAGEPLSRFLANGGNPEDVLKEMNAVYRESLQNP